MKSAKCWGDSTCYAPNLLTHSILTAKHFFFFNFYTFSSCVFQFIRPKHDNKVKFTSCSTKRTIKATLMYKIYINYLIKIIKFGAKNGPVGWNGLSLTHKCRVTELIQFNSILYFNSHRAIQFFYYFSIYLCHLNFTGKCN